MNIFISIILILFTTSCQSLSGYFSGSEKDYPDHYYEKESGQVCKVSKEEVVKNLYVDFKKFPLVLSSDQRCKQWKNCWVCRGEGSLTSTIDHFKSVEDVRYKKRELRKPMVFNPTFVGKYGIYFSNYFGRYGECGSFDSIYKFSQDLAIDLMSSVSFDEVLFHFVSKCSHSMMGKVTNLGQSKSDIKINCNSLDVFDKRNIDDINMQKSGKLVDLLKVKFKEVEKKYADSTRAEVQAVLAKEIRLILWKTMVGPFSIRKIFEDKNFVNVDPVCRL